MVTQFPMDQLWRMASQGDAYVDGNKAVRFFAKSKLPAATLAQIWAMVDERNEGRLDRTSFEKAMQLIAQAQKVSGLPQMEGVQYSNELPPIPDQDMIRYAHMFEAGPQDRMDGNAARSVFLRSNLPLPLLARIWTLADVNNTGSLSLSEFSTAMHLIRQCMSSNDFQEAVSRPSFVLPQHFIEDVGRAMGMTLSRNTSIHRSSSFKASSSPGRTSTAALTQDLSWAISAEQKEKFSVWFQQIDTQRKGWISGQEAAAFFLKSKLSEATLAHVWELADIRKQGRLVLDEFCVAMVLIQDAMAGKELPSVLPNSLVPPSLRSSTTTHVPSLPGPSSSTRANIDDFIFPSAPTQQTMHLASDDPFGLATAVSESPILPMSSRSSIAPSPPPSIRSQKKPSALLMDILDPLSSVPANERVTPYSRSVEGEVSAVLSSSLSESQDPVLSDKMSDIKKLSDDIAQQSKTSAETVKERALLEAQLAQLNNQRRDLSIRLAQAQAACQREQTLLSQTKAKLKEAEDGLVQDEQACELAERMATEAQAERANIEVRMEQVQQLRHELQQRKSTAERSVTGWRLEREGAEREVAQAEEELRVIQADLASQKAPNSLSKNQSQEKPLWEAFDEDDYVQLGSEHQQEQGADTDPSFKTRFDFDAAFSQFQQEESAQPDKDDFDRAFADFAVDSKPAKPLAEDDFGTETFASVKRVLVEDEPENDEGR